MTDETRNGWQSEWGDLKCARLSGRVCVCVRVRSGARTGASSIWLPAMTAIASCSSTGSNYTRGWGSQNYHFESLKAFEFPRCKMMERPREKPFGSLEASSFISRVEKISAHSDTTQVLAH